MRSELKEASIWALWLFVIIAIVTTIVLLSGRVAAPFAEETRRKTQVESQAYQDGMAIDLDNLCREWLNSTDNAVKATLADTIRLRSSRYTGNLPAHVKVCVNEVR